MICGELVAAENLSSRASKMFFEESGEEIVLLESLDRQGLMKIGDLSSGVIAVELRCSMLSVSPLCYRCNDGCRYPFYA